MKNEKSDFQGYLRSELIRRCRSNPRYSLRAFAKNLGMDNSTLSKIINGKRPVGEKTIRSISEKLGLREKEITKFIGSADFDKKFAMAEYEILSDDIAAFISDWYYYGILELIRVDDFKFSNKSISKALGISVHEAKDAIERLVRLNLIAVDGETVTDLTSGRSTNISSQASSFARRNQQKQILQKAIDAIDDVSVDLRNNTSMTFAIDSSKLQEAGEAIQKFRRQMGHLLSRDEKRDQVYNLAIALYPISKIKREEQL